MEKKRKQKEENAVLYLFIRYLTLAMVGILLPVFYQFFFPLTIWPSFFLLNLFYSVSISGNILFIEGLEIEIVNACIAGSAYYLLLILNLTTNMQINQRIFSLLFSFSSLLFLNILRIFLLSILYIENFAFFTFVHELFWYVLSVVFVVAIWFLTILLFKIKTVPVYSDLKKIKVKTHSS